MVGEGRACGDGYRGNVWYWKSVMHGGGRCMGVLMGECRSQSGSLRDFRRVQVLSDRVICYDALSFYGRDAGGISSIFFSGRWQGGSVLMELWRVRPDWWRC